MHSIRSTTALLALAVGSLTTACNSSSDATGTDPGGGGPVTGGPGGGGGVSGTESLDVIDLASDPDGDRIVDLPAGTDPVFTRVFDRYAAVERAAGRIHVLAQAGVGDDRVARVRSILDQHLRDVAGTGEGSDKSDVVAAMINVGATFALFESAATLDANDPDVQAFLVEMNGNVAALPAERVIVEGTAEYVQILPAEDNTFGAAAELVLRAGLLPARAAFADELRVLRQNAIVAGHYVEPAGISVEDRDPAFLSLVLDVHGGVWGHDPNGDGTAGSNGTYAFSSRADMAAGDPDTHAWIERFFTPDHDFVAALPEAFSGNFDCLYRVSTPYSARSQHLRHVRLTGTNVAEIFGAPFDTHLEGNVGNNNLKGRAGDDVLVGDLGFDTAVFSGPQANYVITFQGATVTVEDVLGGHDGTDTLVGFERLQFTDGGVNL